RTRPRSLQLGVKTIARKASSVDLNPIKGPGARVPGAGAVPIGRCRRRPLKGEHFFHWTMTVLALGFIAVALLGFYCTSLYLAPLPLLARVLLLTFLLALLFFYRWRREQRLVNVLEIVSWSILFGILYALPEYIAARCRFELRDAWLAGLDQVLGLE